MTYAAAKKDLRDAVRRKDEKIIVSGAGSAAAGKKIAAARMEAERIAEDPSLTMRETKLEPEQRHRASF